MLVTVSIKTLLTHNCSFAKQSQNFMALTKLIKYCQLIEVYQKVKLCIITHLYKPYWITVKKKRFEKVVAKVVMNYHGLSHTERGDIWVWFLQ